MQNTNDLTDFGSSIICSIWTCFISALPRLANQSRRSMAMIFSVAMTPAMNWNKNDIIGDAESNMLTKTWEKWTSTGIVVSDHHGIRQLMADRVRMIRFNKYTDSVSLRFQNSDQDFFYIVASRQRAREAVLQPIRFWPKDLYTVPVTRTLQSRRYSVEFLSP